MTMLLTPYDIAKVCHEANCALQMVYGDPHIPVGAVWEALDTREQRSIILGVQAAQAGADPKQLHDEWCKAKLEDGWVYGKEKDSKKKTHPCLTSYNTLPEADRLKDVLFRAIVVALS